MSRRVLSDTTGSSATDPTFTTPAPAYAGTELDEQVAVATATTVQIPTAGNLPAVPYRIIFSVDNASVGIWEFRRVSGSAFGHTFYPSMIVSISMAASEAIFVSHDNGSAQDINVTIEPLS